MSGDGSKPTEHCNRYQGDRMKRTVATLLSIALAANAVFAAAPASAETAPPPLASTTQAAVSGGAAKVQVQAATATIGWSVYFGTGYNYAPVIPSNRSPAWTVSAGNPYWVFQADCNAPLYSTSGGGAYWATNTVSQLRPCTLSFQNNAEVIIRNQPGQIGWRTNVIHSGTVYAAMALYDSGCLVEYYHDAPTNRWVNSWRTNLTGIGIDCASYTA